MVSTGFDVGNELVGTSGRAKAIGLIIRPPYVLLALLAFHSTPYASARCVSADSRWNERTILTMGNSMMFQRLDALSLMCGQMYDVWYICVC